MGSGPAFFIRPRLSCQEQELSMEKRKCRYGLNKEMGSDRGDGADVKKLDDFNLGQWN